MNKIITFLVLAFTGQFVSAQSVKEGITLLEKDNIPSARTVFQHIIEKDPSNAEAWFYLGEMAYNNEKFDSAAWFLTRPKLPMKTAISPSSGQALSSSIRVSAKRRKSPSDGRNA